VDHDVRIFAAYLIGDPVHEHQKRSRVAAGLAVDLNTFIALTADSPVSAVVLRDRDDARGGIGAKQLAHGRDALLHVLGIGEAGLMMLRHVLGLSLAVLAIILLLAIAALYKIYNKSKKFNTVAVMTGAIGYMLLYASLITLSLQRNIMLPIPFYIAAIVFFFMLCGIGIKADLKNPKIHWVIEISNVMCQFLVAVGTVILFSR
jgi:hypothetical protein